MFNNSANFRLLNQRGFAVGPEGVTPEVILDVTNQCLSRFGLPIRPIGPGAASRDEWSRFVGKAFSLGMNSVSVWRYGTSEPGVWDVLKQKAPPEAVVSASANPAPTAPLPPIAPPISVPPGPQATPRQDTSMLSYMRRLFSNSPANNQPDKRR
jgi:hypothetical protein